MYVLLSGVQTPGGQGWACRAPHHSSGASGCQSQEGGPEGDLRQCSRRTQPALAAESVRSHQGPGPWAPQLPKSDPLAFSCSEEN